MLRGRINGSIFKRLNSSIHNNDDPFVILPARKSGILPPTRPGARKKRSAGLNAHLAELEQNRQDLTSDLLLSGQQQVASQNINSLKPNSPFLSGLEYKNLVSTLSRGYTKHQLRDYLTSNKLSVGKSMKKPDMVAKILGLWKIAKRDGDQSVVENSIELTERDFVLCIANNGQLLRELAKSGATLKLDPARYRIHIASTSQTFDWISARIHQMANSLFVDEINLGELKKLIEPTRQELMIMQYLTNTYFMADEENNSLIIYSRDKRSLALARQLLLQIAPKPRTSSSWYYDVNQENISHSRFFEYSDLSGLPWFDRSNQWFRWQHVKSKDAREPHKPQYSLLESARFNSQDARPQDVRDQLADQLVNGSPLAITATLGQILHRVGQNTVLPNAGMIKTFDTNAPLIRRFGGQIGDYEHDIVQDFSHKDEAADNVEAADDSAMSAAEIKEDPWEYLLSDGPKVASKPSETNFKTVHQVMRVRLYPSLLEDGGAASFTGHAPIEIWCPLVGTTQVHTKKQRIDVENCQIERIDHENSQYLSLPNKLSDLKFTTSNAESLELSDELREYIGSIAVNNSGPIYIPPSLQLNGRSYSLAETSFITQRELNFNGYLLQLLDCDSGKFGGNRIEASLVLHRKQDDAEFSKDQLKAFIDCALELVKQAEVVKVDLSDM